MYPCPDIALDKIRYACSLSLSSLPRSKNKPKFSWAIWVFDVEVLSTHILKGSSSARSYISYCKPFRPLLIFGALLYFDHYQFIIYFNISYFTATMQTSSSILVKSITSVKKKSVQVKNSPMPSAPRLIWKPTELKYIAGEWARHRHVRLDSLISKWTFHLGKGIIEVSYLPVHVFLIFKVFKNSWNRYMYGCNYRI